MREACSRCDDLGLEIVLREDGTRVARPCGCVREKKLSRHIEVARIPERFKLCAFENFDTSFSRADKSLGEALMQAKNFVKTYPLETEGKGLLFVGRPGLGKTHLAVATLRKLMEERGAQGLFVDYRDLLKQVQNSYNPSVAATELQILRPVFEAEFLIIDDLGASKASDWVFDTVAHILNSRYNRQLSTIMTTNFPNFPETPYKEWSRMSIEQRTMRPNTLGDQIGDRVRSRLHEMCIIVELMGVDVRRSYKRANFAKPPLGSPFSRELSDKELAEAQDQSDTISPEPTESSLRKPVTRVESALEEEEVVGWKRLGKFAAPHRSKQQIAG